MKVIYTETKQKVNIPTIYKKKKNKNQNLSFLYVISPNLNAQFMRKTKNYTKIENVA